MTTIDETAQYQHTIILRSNPGMIRDCWIEKADDTNKIAVVLRQIRFYDDGRVDSKVIRFVGITELRLINKMIVDYFKDLKDMEEKNVGPDEKK